MALFYAHVGQLEETELPDNERDLRFLTTVMIQLFTGARTKTIAKIKLRHVTIVWLEHESHGWVPGVLLDYKSLKYNPTNDRTRCAE